MGNAKTICPYADKCVSARSIHCEILRRRGAKWDFCIRQEFCRVSGQYEIKSGECSLKKQGE